jgi:predicted HicB family RNase H-like nuclease
MSSKSKRVQVRLTPEQHAALLALAEKKRWSLQTLLEVMVEKMLEKNDVNGNGKDT